MCVFVRTKKADRASKSVNNDYVEIVKGTRRAIIDRTRQRGGKVPRARKVSSHLFVDVAIYRVNGNYGTLEHRMHH